MNIQWQKGFNNENRETRKPKCLDGLKEMLCIR